MGILDSIFGGGSKQQTVVQRQSNDLPGWMQEGVQEQYGKAKTLADRPYPTYNEPRIAPFSADTQNAFDATRSASGVWQPLFSQAQAFGQLATQGLPGANVAAYSDPYINLLKQGVGGDFESARGLYGQAAPAGANIGQAVQPYAEVVGQGVSPYLSQAASAASAGGGAISPADIARYMDPNIQANLQPTLDEIMRQYEVGRTGRDANAVFRGSFGGDRQGVVEASAIRDRAALSGQATAQAYQQAYAQALAAAQAEKARTLQSGQQFGTLGAQQQALNQAGLTAQQSEAARALAAGGQFQNLGQAGAGIAQQGLQTALGQEAAQAGRYAQGATQFGQLATQLPALQYSDAAALEGIGQSQEQKDQQHLDVQYQDFLNQFNYPRQNIDWLLSVLQGLPGQTGSTTTSTGPAPQGNSLAQTLGGLAAIYGLMR